MKYKLIGIISYLLISIIVIAVSINLSSDDKRYHQHLEKEEKITCSHNDNRLCTHLPIVEVKTNGKDIPGKKVVDKNGVVSLTKAEDGNDYITVDFSIIDNEEKNNHIGDSPKTKTLAQINVRGNSSRSFVKLGYDVRLVFKNGENNPEKILGMEEHHEWVLHGPYLDKTLIRNYMWYNIAGEIMDYAPNVRFCELVIDGKYQGIYLIVEKISAGKNGARLSLSVDKKYNTFSGYLLRLDRGSKEEIKNLNTFSMYSGYSKTIINIEYPGTSNLNLEIRNSIEKDFSEFEKMLYSYDYNSNNNEYSEYIDVNSFVDYFILNELTVNYDVGAFSTYIYKDFDGKYRMCVWDFNNALDNYQHKAFSYDGFNIHNGVWFNALFKSDYFVDLCIKRYKELRKSILSDEYLLSYIDDTISFLGSSIERNSRLYIKSFDENLLYPEDRNIKSFEEAVFKMKDFLLKRTTWLDNNIESLKSLVG